MDACKFKLQFSHIIWVFKESRIGSSALKVRVRVRDSTDANMHCSQVNDDIVEITLCLTFQVQVTHNDQELRHQKASISLVYLSP